MVPDISQKDQKLNEVKKRKLKPLPMLERGKQSLEKNFQVKSLKISKYRITKNSNLLMTFFILGLKNLRYLVFT